MSAAPIQGQIEKIKKRKLNYTAMRADGELPREEYQALCKQADDEIARLEQELKAHQDQRPGGDRLQVWLDRP